MRNIDNLSLDGILIARLKELNINYIEELIKYKRSNLKDKGFNNSEINRIIISLQLLGLDLNKKK